MATKSMFNYILLALISLLTLSSNLINVAEIDQFSFLPVECLSHIVEYFENNASAFLAFKTVNKQMHYALYDFLWEKALQEKKYDRDSLSSDQLQMIQDSVQLVLDKKLFAIRDNINQFNTLQIREIIKRNRHSELIQKVKDYRFRKNYLYKDNENHLTLAAQYHHHESIDILLTTGMNIDSSRSQAKFADWIRINKCTDCIDLLLKHRINLNTLICYDQLPLVHSAAKVGWLNGVEHLIGCKADVNLVDTHNKRPLYYALLCSENKEYSDTLGICTLLVDGGAKVKEESTITLWSKLDAITQCNSSYFGYERDWLLEILERGCDYYFVGNDHSQ